MGDIVAYALKILNEALERDPVAISRLINLRVDCNSSLAAHPTIQVADYSGQHKVGVLGLLNATLSDSPGGVIGAKGALNSQTGKFVNIRQFIDVRENKLDKFV